MIGQPAAVASPNFGSPSFWFGFSGKIRKYGQTIKENGVAQNPWPWSMKESNNRVD